MPKTYVYTAFGGYENQKFMDLPKPLPQEGQLLVRVRAAGVNPKDWKEPAGYYNSGPLDAPMPLGSEVAGVIEELGANVHGFVVGDEVFGSVTANGAYSEYSVLLATEAALKPAHVSFIDAAALPVAAATAYTGVRQLELRPGETLLIIGAGGGVGVAAVQIATAEGVRVVGTASASKKELIDSIGATHIEYGENTVGRVRAAAPDGIDAIFDMVGGDAMRELGGLVTEGSRIVAAATPAAAAEFGGKRVGRSRGASVLNAIAEMVATGTLNPFVTKVFSFDRVRDALEFVEAGHVTGKVVVEIA